MTMITETTKLCTKCGLVKPVEDYSLTTSGNPRGACKPCRVQQTIGPEHRDRHLKLRYNFTLDQYHEMLDKQNGHCAICPQTPAEEFHNTLSVDHNHETDEVRGLLCNRCNRAIGLLRDSAALAFSAGQYILERGSYSK